MSIENFHNVMSSVAAFLDAGAMMLGSCVESKLEEEDDDAKYER